MLFIGMQDDDIARQAVPSFAAIAEGLHALQGDPQRIGVMAMGFEGGAGEARLDPLDAGKGRRRDDRITRRIAAQTSKTLDGLRLHMLWQSYAERVKIM